MDQRALLISLMSGLSVIVLGTAVVMLSWDWILEILVVTLGLLVMLVPLGHVFRPTAELEGNILKLRGMRLEADLDLGHVTSYKIAGKVRVQFRWKGSNGVRYQSGIFRVDGRDSYLCYDRRVKCAIVLYTTDMTYVINQGSEDDTRMLLERMRPFMRDAERSCDQETVGTQDLRSPGFEALAIMMIVIFAAMLVSAIILF